MNTNPLLHDNPADTLTATVALLRFVYADRTRQRDSEPSDGLLDQVADGEAILAGIVCAALDHARAQLERPAARGSSPPPELSRRPGRPLGRAPRASSSLTRR